MPRTLVSMSGGVDSSVAAALLKQQGHDVVGCFMRLGSPGETLDTLMPADEPDERCNVRIGKQGCCSINDAADAREVASRLDIPFYVCNFKKDFGRIIDYFVDEYAEGRTPNPCVRCNDWLKFGKLHDYASQIGADFVASGHYARVDPATPSLKKGVDDAKDQSYVLFGVPRDRLATMLLPIGEFQKSTVRDMARDFDLPVFDKPDSQEICFVPDNDYAALVERRRPDLKTEGDILDEDGRVVGTHPGQHHFTIGQRRGVGVAFGHPIYVVDRDPRANTITVGRSERLLSTTCRAAEANWLVEPPTDWLACDVKYRYNTPAARGRVRAIADLDAPTPSGRTGAFEVVFDEPRQAVAPGQAIVLYDDDVVLGGGWIIDTGGDRA